MGLLQKLKTKIQQRRGLELETKDASSQKKKATSSRRKITEDVITEKEYNLTRLKIDEGEVKYEVTPRVYNFIGCPDGQNQKVVVKVEERFLEPRYRFNWSAIACEKPITVIMVAFVGKTILTKPAVDLHELAWEWSTTYQLYRQT